MFSNGSTKLWAATFYSFYHYHQHDAKYMYKYVFLSPFFCFALGIR